MYSKTRFRELLEGLPRGVFDRFVSDLGSDKYSKGFSSWDHFVVMLFGQFSGCQSLRKLESSFNAHTAHHYHLGTHSIKRSTLSDANGQMQNCLPGYVDG